MKGIELPVNVLIILVLGLIILIAVIVLVQNGSKPATDSVDLTTAKNNACQMLVSLGCHVNPQSVRISNFDANKKDGLDAGDNLMELCKNYYLIDGSNDNYASVEDQCRVEICGCDI